jgi:hypothetical protein
MMFLLPNRPRAEVFHIVRHPGGYLNSWRNRVLGRFGEPRISSQNCERLREIAEGDARWSERFGEIEAMDVFESELWYWRYFNETVYEIGHGFPHYRMVVYEDLAAHPVDETKRAYDSIGLEWNEEIATWTADLCAKSTMLAAKWQQELTPEQKHLADRFAEESPLWNSWQNHHREP